MKRIVLAHARAALAGLTAALVLAACGGSAAPAPAASAPSQPGSAAGKPAASQSRAAAVKSPGSGPLVSVKISNPSPAVSLLPFYAALAQGYFKDEHLDVTIVQMAPPVAVAALSKGDIDFIDTPSDSVTGDTKGLPFRIVYEAWDKSPWSIIGKKSINSIPELKGKVIGIHATGTAPDAFLRAGLKAANLSENDVQLLHLNGTQDIFAAVIGGKVDAGVVSPPFDIQAAAQGAHQIAPLGSYLQIPYIGLATTVPYLQKHHDAAVGTIRALWRANAWIRANPEPAAQLIAQKVGVPVDVARQSYKEMLPLLTTTGQTPTAGLQQTVQLLEDVSHSTITANLQDMVDNGPLQEATAKS